LPCRIKKIFIFTKFILCFSLINFYFFSYSIAFSDVSKKEIDNVYELLQQKKFNEGVEQLKALSLKNNIDAQLLYSKILFTGDITPQDFENSYLWASSALLGGMKSSQNIVEELNNYLTEKQTDDIKNRLKLFFEKRALIKDKRAIIQIAKFYESYLDPPDIINAYTWYNIAVAVGIKTAKIKRNELLDKLNEEDLLKAQTLSIKLFKQINS
jgi:TPR repeat protein